MGQFPLEGQFSLEARPEMFSRQGRSNMVSQLKSETLDVLVIGGGVTGAGILLDATTRGMKAGLIEMQDFAEGTSSRSTKLVHGGLRYLRQFDVALLAEVGREREIVYENAPHVTTPLWMLLPIVEKGSYGRFMSSVGLYIYDKLAKVKRHERRKMLSKAEALEKEPLLRQDVLKGAGYYVEYRTDDARLTLEIMKEAVHRGAVALNYTRAEGLVYSNGVESEGLAVHAEGTVCGGDANSGRPTQTGGLAYEKGRVVGASVIDKMTGERYVVRARKVVNATGPWVDELRLVDKSKFGKTMHLTKGVHIVVDKSRFPLRNPVYFDVPDGRMVFAIPREGKTYVGTTDTDYVGDPTNPRTTQADRDYLIGCVNYMFPSVELTDVDVESFWAGVRPLIHEEGKSPSEISRRDEVIVSDSGLITIAGGKLTGYRKMADKVVSLIGSQLSSESGGVYTECVTDHLELSGAKFGGSAHMRQYLDARILEGKDLGLTRAEAESLAGRYGSNVGILYEILRNDGHEAETWGLSREVFAPLVYGMRHEMVVTPSDFFVRRTGAMFFNVGFVREWKESVIRYMAHANGWSDDETARHGHDLELHIAEATEVV